MLSLLKTTFANFGKHNCPRMAAALAYYALFSMPPLLVISIALASFVADMASLGDNGQVRHMIEREATQSLGTGAAAQIDAMIEHASTIPKSPWGFVIGGALFLFGASGVMVQLQSALNEVWSVQPDPDRSTVRLFLLKRVLSFAMVLGVGFLMLTSMMVSASLTMMGDYLAQFVGEGMSSYVPMLSGIVANYLVATLLFAAMFQWLPDARIEWRNVWVGAAVTALLFIIGKTLLAVYFAKIDVGSAYGAAGSLALILTWVYYSGMVFLLGAEFTRAVAKRRQGKIEPDEGAVKVETAVKTKRD